MSDDSPLEISNDKDSWGASWYGNEINPGHAVGAGIGLLYVANPWDIIPDALPVIGYMDDIAVFRLTTTMGGFIWDIFS